MSRSHPNTQALTLEVVVLKREGMSCRAIARALKLGRKTVSKILAEHRRDRAAPQLALEQPPARRPRPSKLDPYRERIDELLERFPDITAQRVFEELRGAGFKGGYTVVKKLVRKIRPKPKPTISLPTERYEPGKMSECDWSPYNIKFTHAPQATLQCFGYFLNFSHRKFFHFYRRSDLHALMDGHVQAFDRFGGVAAECKYDGQKAVVVRWEGRQPIYNLRFVDFATFYEFRPRACRPRHPNDKPGIERSFWELEKSFFNGREFRDEQDLHEQLDSWMSDVSDLRPHKKLKRKPLELFTEEQAWLLPLPSHPYDTARVVYRLCDIEGYVAWDGNRYSLPSEHVTDILPARITEKELFIYAADLSLIARHELHPKGAGDDVILPGHRHRAARRGPDLDQLRVTYDALGPEASSFLKELVVAQPRSAAYHARLILTLRERYQTHELVQALEHARRYGALNHTAVGRILQSRATPRRLDEYVAEEMARKLRELVGESTTEPRDLSEYDALPCWSGRMTSTRSNDRCRQTHASNDQLAPARQEQPDNQHEPTLEEQQPSRPCTSASESTSHGSD